MTILEQLRRTLGGAARRTRRRPWRRSRSGRRRRAAPARAAATAVAGPTPDGAEPGGPRDLGARRGRELALQRGGPGRAARRRGLGLARHRRGGPGRAGRLRAGLPLRGDDPAARRGPADRPAAARDQAAARLGRQPRPGDRDHRARRPRGHRRRALPDRQLHRLAVRRPSARTSPPASTSSPSWLQNGPLHVNATYFNADEWVTRITNWVKTSQDTITTYAGEITLLGRALPRRLRARAVRAVLLPAQRARDLRVRACGSSRASRAAGSTAPP